MIPESKNFIFWFTGLSGSGKTFLILKLKNYLEKKKIKKIKVIDGDTFRKNIKNYKYDIQSREKIGFLKADLAKQFYNKGYVVLVSGIAHKKIWRAKLRKILYNCNYSEIYLKCPINECKKRKIYIYQPLKNRQIVGLSGCGKSTLLRMVAGLEDANEGNILIDNKKVNELEPMERNIAMVFQNYALYPHMTVFGNMAYGLKIAKVPKEEIESRVQKAAEILELGELLERKPNQLSGGQRQRVAMGRAIVRNPVAFLFDEPLSNLDAKLRVQMRLEIKKLQTQLKTTSLYVTHDQVEAMTLADRMIVMNEGNVEHIGTPLEVYTKPKTLFTAQFIGSPAMNILKGNCQNNKVSFANKASISINLKFNGPVNVGMRPEDFELDPNGPIKLKVELVELIGANTLIHGKLENSNEILVASISGVVKEDTIGKNINLSIQDNKLHLFDTNTDLRIN